MATALDRLHSRSPWNGRGEPTTPPGVVLLVGVHARGANCFVTQRADTGVLHAPGAAPVGNTMELINTAADAWDTAAHAAAAALPEVMAERIDNLYACPVAAPVVHGLPDGVRDLDGSSYGLALAVCAASRMLDQRVGAHVAFLATVDRIGGLGVVEGLETKLDAITREAPSVTTVWVAPAQLDEAIRLSRNKHSVKTAGLLVDVLRQVLDVQRALDAVWSSPELRMAVVDPLFARSLAGTDATIAQREQADFAGRLLEAGVDDPLARFKLTAARAFFKRHVDHSVALASADLSLLDALGVPQRLATLANLVQHHCDTGTPDIDAVRVHSDPLLSVGVRDRFSEHWRLVGPWSEHLFYRAEFAAALEHVRDGLSYYAEPANRAEASHVVRRAIWFAGALEDRALYAAAVKLWNAAGGEHTLEKRTYVQTVGARACVWLGNAVNAEEWARLPALKNRSWIDLARVRNTRMIERLKGATPAPHAPTPGAIDPTVRAFDQLIVLDDAIANGDVAAGEAALQQAVTHLRHPLQHITATAERRGLTGMERLQWVQRMFPY